MGRLQDKVAVITGAAAGFGKGMALRFAAEGASVVVADINDRRAREVAAEIGERAVPVQTDVSLASEIDEMVSVAMNAFGRIDIMVNNAGYTHVNGDMLAVPEHEFDMIAGVNMKAIYRSTLAVVPAMKERGSGIILNTASTAGIRPRPGLTWYNASKGWVITATKSMAAELAPHGIRVNCLCPVAGDTGMLARFIGSDTAEARERFRQSVPMGRFSTPDDIANAALWLCSDEAALVTGVALEVDGGRCI